MIFFILNLFLFVLLFPLNFSFRLHLLVARKEKKRPCFLKLFLRTIFENLENNKMVFFEKFLLLFEFIVFYVHKHVIRVFLVLFGISEKKNCFK